MSVSAFQARGAIFALDALDGLDSAVVVVDAVPAHLADGAPVAGLEIGLGGARAIAEERVVSVEAVAHRDCDRAGGVVGGRGYGGSRNGGQGADGHAEERSRRRARFGMIAQWSAPASRGCSWPHRRRCPAQSIVKCVNVDGNVTYQDAPCTPGHAGRNVELPKAESREDTTAWEEAARSARVVRGMPKRWVLRAKGAPYEIRRRTRARTRPKYGATRGKTAP